MSITDIRSLGLEPPWRIQRSSDTADAHTCIPFWVKSLRLSLSGSSCSVSAGPVRSKDRRPHVGSLQQRGLIRPSG